MACIEIDSFSLHSLGEQRGLQGGSPGGSTVFSAPILVAVVAVAESPLLAVCLFIRVLAKHQAAIFSCAMYCLIGGLSG